MISNAHGVLAKARGFARLTRLRSTFTASLICAESFYLIGSAWTSQAVLSSGAALAVIAVAQVANDICDVSRDVAAGRGRPIAIGQVSLRFAYLTGIVLAITAIVLSYFAGSRALVVGTSTLLTGVLYSVLWKLRFPVGHLLVALVSAAMIAFPTPPTQRARDSLISCAAFIFLFVLGNEVYKSILDQAGDRLAGIRTIATECDAVSCGFAITTCVLGVYVAFFYVVGSGIAEPPFIFVGMVTILVPITVSTALYWSYIGAIRRSFFQLARRWWLMAWYPGVTTFILFRR